MEETTAAAQSLEDQANNLIELALEDQANGLIKLVSFFKHWEKARAAAADLNLKEF